MYTVWYEHRWDNNDLDDNWATIQGTGSTVRLIDRDGRAINVRSPIDRHILFIIPKLLSDNRLI